MEPGQTIGEVRPFLEDFPSDGLTSPNPPAGPASRAGRPPEPGQTIATKSKTSPHLMFGGRAAKPDKPKSLSNWPKMNR